MCSSILEVDRLRTSIELNSRLALLLESIRTRPLEPAKRGMRGSARCGLVDFHDPHLNPVGEFESLVEPVRYYPRRQAVSYLIRLLDRMIEIPGAKYRDDWAEDLLLRDPHVWVDVIEDCRQNIVTLIWARLLAGQQLGTFPLTRFHIGKDCRLLFGAGEGTHRRCFIHPISNDDHFSRRGQLGDKRVGDGFFDNYSACGGARLPAQAKASSNRQCHRCVKVRVSQDNQCVLSTHF